MIETVFGTKIGSTRGFIQDGSQIPISKAFAAPMTVIQIKTKVKDGYDAVQLGIGEKRADLVKKPLLGSLKKIRMAKPPRYLREVKITDPTSFKLGQVISPTEVLAAGDLVNVAGISKGKGFQGVVKRWHFAGGPRTHGQSDRERAPGSIGQTTTPGRVYKGKKMAGRMGGEKVVIKNLTVLDFDQEKNLLSLKGLVPGSRGSLLSIKKVGKQKNFKPLLRPGEAISTEEQAPVPSKVEADKEAKKKKDQSDKSNLPSQNLTAAKGKQS